MVRLNEEKLIIDSFLSEIIQVCTVTHNLESTVHELSRHFGIGPFKCWDLKPPSLFKTKFHGRESFWTYKVAIAFVGNIHWEVLQPLEGASIYKEYLNDHGEGVHHILVNSDSLNFEQTIERIAPSRASLVQEAMLNVPVQLFYLTLPRVHFAYDLLCPKFAYLDLKDDIKTTLEVMKFPFGISSNNSMKMGKGDYWIPENSIDLDAALPNGFIDKIFKIGIVTRDLDAALRNYVNRLKVGPWKVYNLQAPRIIGMKMRSQDTDFSLRLAIASLGDTWIEIVEPLSGVSLYQEFLDTHGEGVHYLGVSTGDMTFSETIDKFTSLGCPVVMEGELKNAYRFAHLDTKPFIKTTLEVISIPVNEITPVLERLKPDQVYPFE